MGRLAYLVLLVGSQARAKPVLVIDPGHGGTNFGAPTLKPDTYEKNLTLDLARRVREQLPELEVVLTRENDRFLTLRGRAAVANRLNASAFVSLHLNSSAGRGQRGFETYVYGSGPLLESSARLGVVGTILADLQSRSLFARSRHLARVLRDGLATARGREFDQGNHASSFDVLQQVASPAVLVEVAYLDHPQEGAEMLEPAARQAVAVGIAQGLRRFFTHGPREASASPLARR